MSALEGRFVDLLLRIQAVAAAYAAPTVWARPGQLAWSSVFSDPDSAVAVWDEESFGWLADGWLEIGGSPERVADVVAWAEQEYDGAMRDAWESLT